MPKTVLHTIVGWLVFSVLLSLALLVSSYLFSEENLLQALNGELLFQFWLIRAILVLTGFIVFGFMKALFSTWFRQKGSTNIWLIFIFYVLMLASYLLTYLMAYDGIDSVVLIDAPLMIAVATLIMGVIPYFRHTLFSTRLD